MQTLVQMSACLDSQKAISSFLSIVFVSPMQRSNCEKASVFNYLHNGIESQTHYLKNAELGQYFHFSN